MATSTELGLDTSVVMRLLIGAADPQHDTAVSTLRSALKSGHRIIVSDLVVAEAYFALQAAYGVPKKDAIRSLLCMFDSGDVNPESGGCAPDVLRESLTHASKPGFVDRLIHAQYQSRHASMLTFEKAAKKLPDTRVIDGGHHAS